MSVLTVCIPAMTCRHHTFNVVGVPAQSTLLLLTVELPSALLYGSSITTLGWPQLTCWCFILYFGATAFRQHVGDPGGAAVSASCWLPIGDITPGCVQLVM
jgi:hypothetical protein